MELSQAIIINLLQKDSNRYIFFDARLGTLNVRVSTRSRQTPKCGALPRGAQVHYRAVQKGNWYVCDYIEIIAMPSAWVAQDIWFMHHMLELIEFFVPRGDRAEDIFAWCSLLYQAIEENCDVQFFKKLFVCKFFVMTGIYPEPLSGADRHFFSLIVSGAGWGDYLGDGQEKYVFLEKKMIQWLQECIRLHPQADRFKTMNIQKVREPWSTL